MKVSLKLVSILATSFFFSSCATPTRKITPIPVSSIERNKYESFTCEQLYQEVNDVLGDLEFIAKIQNKKVRGDKWKVGGSLFLWPTLFFLGDDETAGKVAVLKGRLKALERVSIKKNCQDSLKLFSSIRFN